MTGSILRASKDDAIQIKRILHSAHKKNRIQGYFFPISTVTRKHLLNLMKRERYFILKDKGVNIGTVSLRKRHGSIEIRSLAVLNKYKRNGFGKKLLSFAEKYAKKSGYHWVKLQTLKEHPTLPIFYRKQGYRPEKTSKKSRWITFQKKL